MIPSGDHSSRSILHRRVSSWAEATQSPLPEDLLSLPSSDADDLSRPLLPQLEYEDASISSEEESIRSLRRKKKWKLAIVFLLLVVSGVSNVVFAKLQSLPMYNYPTFLNVYANFMYIILSLCYIVPACLFGWFEHSIRREHFSLSKKPFLVMGFLDALSAAMQVLATIYLPGTLLVLLPQATIPLSMLASRLLLRERFTPYQYFGAAVVFVGILVVLFPVLTHSHFAEFSCQAVANEDCTVCEMETTEVDCLSHIKQRSEDPLSIQWLYNSTDKDGDDDRYCQWVSRDDSLRKDDFLVFVWSIVMVVACIPMVLSSVYKQVALQVQLDPILVNGLVAFFQLICGIPLAIPAGLASSPIVKPWDLPSNWLQAMNCLFAQYNSIEDGCHPDDCQQAALWVHLGLLSSTAYTISMIFVLKYGSASLLYLGLTLMVPLGHLVFSLNSPSSIHMSDVMGLFVLVAGLVLYRFGHEDEESPPATTAGNPTEGQTEQSEAQGYRNLAATDDKNGFLEFLREPLMLVGDI